MPFGVGADAVGGGFQRRASLGGNGGQRLPQALGGDFQVGGASGVQSVEAMGVIQQRGVALRPHPRQNVAHHGGHGFVGDPFPGGQGFQAWPEIGIGGVQALDVRHERHSGMDAPLVR